MKASRIWLLTFGLGFLALEALLVLALTSPVPYGDLSRIGQVSERQFGWTTPQPHVAPELLRAAPVRQADVLVIGDSFSAGHRWQSVLTGSGLRVATIAWGDIGGRLCSDFDQWLSQTGFRGKWVVIESVERSFGGYLQRSASCRKMKPVPAAEWPIEPTPQHEQPPEAGLNWNATLATGWYSLMRTQRAQRMVPSEHDTDIGPQVRARVVDDGCAMFSNRLCNKPLFFRDDDLAIELSPAQVPQMQAFTRAHASVAIVWMIVPNKTTTYIDPMHGRSFALALNQAGLGPDLFAWTQQHKRKVRDFYLPNDTHLSLQGQLLLGQRMLQAIREREKATAPPVRTDAGGGSNGD